VLDGLSPYFLYVFFIYKYITHTQGINPIPLFLLYFLSLIFIAHTVQKKTLNYDSCSSEDILKSSKKKIENKKLRNFIKYSNQMYAKYF